MEIVKEVGEYKIIKKRSGRYGVKKKTGGWLNGDDKVAVLSKEGLIKLTPAKKKEEPAAEEVASEETAAE